MGSYSQHKLNLKMIVDFDFRDYNDISPYLLDALDCNVCNLLENGCFKCNNKSKCSFVYELYDRWSERSLD